MKIKEIISAIEAFAPRSLMESWDNPGLQVGNPEAETSTVLICLDMTEEILEEALEHQCSLVVTHHPLIFHGLKSLTGATPTERIVERAIRAGIAIYSAHTNLDSTHEGVSHEMAQMLGLKNVTVLDPQRDEQTVGLGVVGEIKPMPALEFLRMVKKTFHVKALRYSAQSKQLVVRRVALCGGAGASLITKAMEAKADIYVTGDLKYHDFTSYGTDLLMADIGHFESELCTERILARVIHETFPALDIRTSEREKNPVALMI